MTRLLQCPQRKLGVLKHCKLNCALLYISCIVSKLWHIRYHNIGNYVNTSVLKSVSKFDYQHASGCASHNAVHYYFDHYCFQSLLLLRSILFYIVTELYHHNIQCRIGLISEVIVIGSNSDQSNSGQHCDWHCQSFFSQYYPLIFSQNIFALVSINFFTIYNMVEPSALHNDYVTLPPSFCY